MEQYNIEDEISLRELIEVLIKKKKLIAIITGVSILIAGILSFFVISPTYESSMVLMAAGATDRTNGNGLDGDIDQMLDSISRYPTMNIETYKQQVKTPEVLNKTIEDLDLEEEYTLNSLNDSITLETINDTQLITIKVANKDPEMAAVIANKVGENFINFVSKNAREKSNNASSYLQLQMEVEKNKYDEALLEQKNLLSEPRSANELSLELDALLIQVTQYKTDLNNLDIKEKGLLASIDAAEKIPSNSSSITLNQNTGSITIDKTEKTLKIELSEVQSSIVSIKEKIVELQKQIEELQIEYQDRFHKESIVTQKVEIARNTYESFVEKYEEVKVTESAEIGASSITIISKAHPANTPVAPRKSLNLAIAGVLGLMIGVFAAFFIEYWQTTDSIEKIIVAKKEDTTEDKE